MYHDIVTLQACSTQWLSLCLRSSFFALVSAPTMTLKKFLRKDNKSKKKKENSLCYTALVLIIHFRVISNVKFAKAPALPY
jgi:hypothetical protein